MTPGLQATRCVCLYAGQRWSLFDLFVARRSLTACSSQAIWGPRMLCLPEQLQYPSVGASTWQLKRREEVLYEFAEAGEWRVWFRLQSSVPPDG